MLLEEQGNMLLIQNSIMAAQQVDTFDRLNKQHMLAKGNIIESALNHEPLFADSYPLDFDNVQVYRYSELT